MAEQVIQEIDDKIQNKKRLTPALPQEDVPIVNIRNVKMLSPPNYKMGEKVQWCFPAVMLCLETLLVQVYINDKGKHNFLSEACLLKEKLNVELI